MKKLYVGNLAYQTTDSELLNLFAQFGAVQSANIVRDKEDNSSKGFAFVEMANDNEAADAMEKANGQEINGRSLRVSEARPRESRPPARNGGGGGGRGDRW